MFHSSKLITHSHLLTGSLSTQHETSQNHKQPYIMGSDNPVKAYTSSSSSYHCFILQLRYINMLRYYRACEKSDDSVCSIDVMPVSRQLSKAWFIASQSTSASMEQAEQLDSMVCTFGVTVCRNNVDTKPWSFWPGGRFQNKWGWSGEELSQYTRFSLYSGFRVVFLIIVTLRKKNKSFLHLLPAASWQSCPPRRD